MQQSAQEITATVFVNRHRLVIDSLRNSEENRRIFKDKSLLDGGFFYVKTPKTIMKWELLTILTINSLY